MLSTAKRVVRCALDDNITGESAKAAYYLFFSIFPLILAGFALTGLVGGEPAFVWIMQRVDTMAPGEGAAILEGFVQEITQQRRFDALSIGLLLAIWSGSNFFAALGQGLDAMFSVEDEASFLKRRGKALLMLFAGGSLLVAGAGIIVLGPALANWLGIGQIAAMLRWPLGFLLVAALMFLMYYILPNRDQSGIRRELAIGAVVAAAAWLLATGGFGFYVRNFADYDQTYGAVGAVIILMLWLYLTALAVLLGGEVAHVLAEKEGGPRADEAARHRRQSSGRQDPDEADEREAREPLRGGETKRPPANSLRSPRHAARRGVAAAAHMTAADANVAKADAHVTAADANVATARRRDRDGADRHERTAWRTAAGAPQGTRLAPSTERASNQKNRQWRRSMATDRNEEFSAGGEFGSGTGEVGGEPFGRTGERGSELRDTAESIKERGEEMLESGRERVSAKADAGRNRVAGKLEELGDRLEERGHQAEQRGGLQQRAGRVAVRAGNALDDSADYIRSHDFEDMRDDLERQIREKPLMSVGIALGAGFLLARILRD